MNLLIDNIIPRLRNFAKQIELKEALVDKVWVIYGENDYIEYEFERSGEIAVTKNGNSYDGTWRILGSGRLKITTNFSNNTLEYDFSVPGILVMKIVGKKDHPFLLFDNKIVKNGDLFLYLDSLEKLDNKEIENSNQIDQEYYNMFMIFLVCSILLLFLFYFMTRSSN